MVTFDEPLATLGVQALRLQTAIVCEPLRPSTTFSLKVTDTVSPLSARPATHAEPIGVQFADDTAEIVGPPVSIVTVMELGEEAVAEPTVAVAVMVCAVPAALPASAETWMS